MVVCISKSFQKKHLLKKKSLLSRNQRSRETYHDLHRDGDFVISENTGRASMAQETGTHG